GVGLATGVGIYGGYNADWSRSLATVTTIAGNPEAVFGTGAINVVLQHLTVHAERGPASASAYGILLIDGSSVTLQRVVIPAGDGLAGDPGAVGVSGGHGDNGVNGGPGA